jgi:hypothetical protein
MKRGFSFTFLNVRFFKWLAKQILLLGSRLLHRLNILLRRVPSGSERIGVYVAYYKAQWVLRQHLEAFRAFTSQPFDYYIFGNFCCRSEAIWFSQTISQFRYPKVFRHWPGWFPLTHGESLHRMVEATHNEIIVLCDVDAFPIVRGWDEHILSQLQTKDIVAAVVDMPHRHMTPFLHPCFLCVKRKFLVDNGLDLLHGEGNDPAYKITKFLLQNEDLTMERVFPLFPTKREIVLGKRGVNQLFGKDDLIHGFGTTYGNIAFHFWFNRQIGLDGIITEPGVKIAKADLDRVISRVFSDLKEQCQLESVEDPRRRS